MLSLAYTLYSAVKLRLISQTKELTYYPPVYTELTVSMTFLKLRSVKKKSVSTDDRV